LIPPLVFHPRGLIGAIVPWNYPFHNVLNPVSAALFSGNAILIKVRSLIPPLVFHPRGLIGAIVPWNYLFHNVLNPVSAALFSGNAILIKVRSLIPTLVFHPRVLIGAIVPWNYPFHNMLNPVSAALFSGNAMLIRCVPHLSQSSRSPPNTEYAARLLGTSSFSQLARPPPASTYLSTATLMHFFSPLGVGACLVVGRLLPHAHSHLLSGATTAHSKPATQSPFLCPPAFLPQP
jgi:hypothetical protein